MPSIASLAWLAVILLIPSLAALALRYLFIRAADGSDADLHPAEELANEMASALGDVVDPIVCGERADHEDPAPPARYAPQENAKPADEAPGR